MKKLFFLLIAIQFTIIGQVNWNTPSIVSNINATVYDRIESYTNSSGNHIAVNSNGTIKYYLINSSGQKIRENLNLDNGCEYSENNYTVAITGYENDVYIVYQKTNKIKILKSTNAGINWSNSIQERTIASTNCNGVDAVFDDKGLHVVWAVKIGNNFETYYERFNRNLLQWEGYKQITDYDANDIGGRPSVTTSENKAHVAYNMNTSEETITISGPAKTRDYNFLTSSWETPQWIEIEPSRIPPPYPGAVIDFTCSNIERITYGGGYLHLINHQLIAVEYTVFHYLYYKRRAVNSSNWETEILVSQDIVFPQRLVKPLFTPNGRLNILCLKGEVAEYKHYYLLNSIKYGPYTISNIGIGAGFCFSSNSNDLYAYWPSYNPSYLYWSKYDAAPLAPQNLSVSVYTVPDHQYPQLSWSLNNEPDVRINDDGYLIERRTRIAQGSWSSWTQIAYSDGSSSTFIDYGIGTAGDGFNDAEYRIRAKDMNNNTSEYSSIIQIEYGHQGMEKKNIGTTTSIEYTLDQNYPNPFNPGTIINYSVKDAGLVKIKVYDILGSEVATLVNETKEAGNFAVEFNAANLPSGVYIYTLHVNGFISSKKMLLMK